MKSDAKIEHIPYDKAYAEGFEDMRRRVPDISKIAAITGYKPKHGIEETITLVAEDIKTKL